ncbi:hypothetical protein LSH36_1514g00002 [Paralvinella palmiformis]|uniref:SH3 domain-containing protein n=1 Tax=Paralvinella palmiformis TaxID=53620 RepID=A0AAD9ISD7_9ANNE|nr:hypothetical protein LSH36_1514g00002 [Paralvinella palmiformis]
MNNVIGKVGNLILHERRSTTDLFHGCTRLQQDQMEQSTEDALLCAQSSIGCAEQLGLFWKTQFWNLEVIVEFDYTSHEDDELTIKQGDIIKDVTKMDGGWWEGTLNGKRGVFPDNFVKEVKKEKAPVTASKKPGGGHVSNLAKNLGHGGIKMGPPPAKLKDVKPEEKKVLAKATFDYEPQQDDELRLTIGEVIEVTKQEQEGWWEGVKKGVTGVFPSNFVEVLQDEAVSEVEKEAHEIKGKKVTGIGLGNIFSDGPVKLKPTGRSETKDEVRTEPISEPRKDLPPDSKQSLPYKTASSARAKGLIRQFKKGASAPPATREPPILPPKEIKDPKPLSRVDCNEQWTVKVWSVKDKDDVFSNMTDSTYHDLCLESSILSDSSDEYVDCLSTDDDDERDVFFSPKRTFSGDDSMLTEGVVMGNDDDDDDHTDDDNNDDDKMQNEQQNLVIKEDWKTHKGDSEGVMLDPSHLNKVDQEPSPKLSSRYGVRVPCKSFNTELGSELTAGSCLAGGDSCHNEKYVRSLTNSIGLKPDKWSEAYRHLTENPDHKKLVRNRLAQSDLYRPLGFEVPSYIVNMVQRESDNAQRVTSTSRTTPKPVATQSCTYSEDRKAIQMKLNLNKYRKTDQVASQSTSFSKAGEQMRHSVSAVSLPNGHMKRSSSQNQVCSKLNPHPDSHSSKLEHLYPPENYFRYLYKIDRIAPLIQQIMDRYHVYPKGIYDGKYSWPSGLPLDGNPKELGAAIAASVAMQHGDKKKKGMIKYDKQAVYLSESNIKCAESTSPACDLMSSASKPKKSKRRLSFSNMFKLVCKRSSKSQVTPSSSSSKNFKLHSEHSFLNRLVTRKHSKKLSSTRNDVCAEHVVEQPVIGKHVSTELVTDEVISRKSYGAEKITSHSVSRNFSPQLFTNEFVTDEHVPTYHAAYHSVAKTVVSTKHVRSQSVKVIQVPTQHVTDQFLSGKEITAVHVRDQSVPDIQFVNQNPVSTEHVTSYPVIERYIATKDVLSPSFNRKYPNTRHIQKQPILDMNVSSEKVTSQFVTREHVEGHVRDKSFIDVHSAEKAFPLMHISDQSNSVTGLPDQECSRKDLISKNMVTGQIVTEKRVPLMFSRSCSILRKDIHCHSDKTFPSDLGTVHYVAKKRIHISPGHDKSTSITEKVTIQAVPGKCILREHISRHSSSDQDILDQPITPKHIQTEYATNQLTDSFSDQFATDFSDTKLRPTGYPSSSNHIFKEPYVEKVVVAGDRLVAGRPPREHDAEPVTNESLVRRPTQKEFDRNQHFPGKTLPDEQMTDQYTSEQQHVKMDLTFRPIINNVIIRQPLVRTMSVQFKDSLKVPCRVNSCSDVARHRGAVFVQYYTKGNEFNPFWHYSDVYEDNDVINESLFFDHSHISGSSNARKLFRKMSSQLEKGYHQESKFKKPDFQRFISQEPLTDQWDSDVESTCKIITSRQLLRTVSEEFNYWRSGKMPYRVRSCSDISKYSMLEMCKDENIFEEDVCSRKEFWHDSVCNTKDIPIFEQLDTDIMYKFVGDHVTSDKMSLTRSNKKWKQLKRNLHHSFRSVYKSLYPRRCCGIKQVSTESLKVCSFPETSTSKVIDTEKPLDEHDTDKSVSEKDITEELHTDIVQSVKETSTSKSITHNIKEPFNANQDVIEFIGDSSMISEDTAKEQPFSEKWVSSESVTGYAFFPDGPVLGQPDTELPVIENIFYSDRHLGDAVAERSFQRELNVIDLLSENCVYKVPFSGDVFAGRYFQRELAINQPLFGKFSHREDTQITRLNKKWKSIKNAVHSSFRRVQKRFVTENQPIVGKDMSEALHTEQCFKESVSDEDDIIIGKELIANETRALAVTEDSKKTVQTQIIKECDHVESPRECDTYKSDIVKACISSESVSDEEVLVKESIAKELRTLAVVKNVESPTKEDVPREFDLEEGFSGDEIYVESVIDNAVIERGVDPEHLVRGQPGKKEVGKEKSVSTDKITNELVIDETQQLLTTKDNSGRIMSGQSLPQNDVAVEQFVHMKPVSKRRGGISFAKRKSKIGKKRLCRSYKYVCKRFCGKNLICRKNLFGNIAERTFDAKNSLIQKSVESVSEKGVQTVLGVVKPIIRGDIHGRMFALQYISDDQFSGTNITDRAFTYNILIRNPLLRASLEDFSCCDSLKVPYEIKPYSDVIRYSTLDRWMGHSEVKNYFSKKNEYSTSICLRKEIQSYNNLDVDADNNLLSGDTSLKDSSIITSDKKWKQYGRKIHHSFRVVCEKLVTKQNQVLTRSEVSPEPMSDEHIYDRNLKKVADEGYFIDRRHTERDLVENKLVFGENLATDEYDTLKGLPKVSSVESATKKETFTGDQVFRQSDIDKSDTHIELTKELNIEEPFIKEFISDESVSDEEVVVKESNSKEPRALAVSHDSEKSVQIQTVRECFSVESPRESETKQPFYEECVSVASARDKDFIIKQSILNEQKTLTVIQDSVKFIQTQTVREFAGVESPEESDTKEPFVEEVISTGSDSDEGVIVKESIPNDLRQLAVSHDSEISVQTQNVKDFVGFESPMEIDTKQPFDEKCISIASSRDEVIFKESVAKELRNLTVIQDSLRVIETQTDREDDIKQTFVEEGISVGSGRYEDVSVESPRQSESVSDEDVIGKESITKDLKTLSITLHTKKSIQAQTHVNFEYPNNTEQSAFEEYVSSESVSDEDVTGKESITKDLKTLTSILHVKKSIQAQTDRELVDVESQKATEQPAFEEYVSSESISDEDVIGKESIIKELKTLSITLHTKKSIQAQTDRELVDVEYPNNTEQSAFEEYVSSESVSDEDVIGKESITKDLKTLSITLHTKKSIQAQTDRELVDVEYPNNTEQSAFEEYVSSESVSDEDVIGKESITKELRTLSITLPTKKSDFEESVSSDSKSIQAQTDRELVDVEYQKATEQPAFEEYVSSESISDEDVIGKESIIKELKTLSITLHTKKSIQAQTDRELVDVEYPNNTEQSAFEEYVSSESVSDEDVIVISDEDVIGKESITKELRTLSITLPTKKSDFEESVSSDSVSDEDVIVIVSDEDVIGKESITKDLKTSYLHLRSLLHRHRTVDVEFRVQKQFKRNVSMSRLVMRMFCCFEEYVSSESISDEDVIEQSAFEEYVSSESISDEDVIGKESITKDLKTLSLILHIKKSIETQTNKEPVDVESQIDTEQSSDEEYVSSESVSDEDVIGKESITKELRTLSITLPTKKSVFEESVSSESKSIETQTNKEPVDVESQIDTEQSSDEEYVSSESVSDEDVTGKESITKDLKTLTSILHVKKSIQAQTDRDLVDVEYQKATEQPAFEEYVSSESISDEDVIGKESIIKELKTLSITLHTKKSIQAQTDRELVDVEYPNNTEQSAFEEYVSSESVSDEDVIGKESITKDLKTLSLILHIKKSIETQTNKEPVDVESQIDTKQSSDEEYVSSESISDEDVIGKESITKELRTLSITLPTKKSDFEESVSSDSVSDEDVIESITKELRTLSITLPTKKSDFEESVSSDSVSDEDVIGKESITKDLKTLSLILHIKKSIETQTNKEPVDVESQIDTEQSSDEEYVSSESVS